MTKRLTKKRIKSFLNDIAILKEEHVDGIGKFMAYFSKIDESYICPSSNIHKVKWMIEKGITEQIQAAGPNGSVSQIGFNPVTQKWWGWSHRACFGSDIFMRFA